MFSFRNKTRSATGKNTRPFSVQEHYKALDLALFCLCYSHLLHCIVFAYADDTTCRQVNSQASLALWLYSLAQIRFVHQNCTVLSHPVTIFLCTMGHPAKKVVVLTSSAAQYLIHAIHHCTSSSATATTHPNTAELHQCFTTKQVHPANESCSRRRDWLCNNDRFPV